MKWGPGTCSIHISSSVTTDQLSCPSDTTPLRNHFRVLRSVFTMFTVAELQPSHCSHQVTLTPFYHVHIVHHGHLVSGHPRLDIYPCSHCTLRPAAHSSSLSRDLLTMVQRSAGSKAVAAVFISLQHLRSPECVHQLLSWLLPKPEWRWRWYWLSRLHRPSHHRFWRTAARLQAAVARCAGGYWDPGCSGGLVLRNTSVAKIFISIKLFSQS